MPKVTPHSAKTRQLAFELWLKHDRPSFMELEELMTAAGTPVDHSTLARFKDKNPLWLSLHEAQKNPIAPEKLIRTLTAAKLDARSLEPDHFIGLKAQLVARLYDAIKTLEINTVDDWERALNNCDRIEALIHAERGKAVAEKDALAVPRGASPSLMARLNPPVTVAPFKKPAAAAKGGAA